MRRSELETTSFDHDDLKQSLIEFLRSTEEFDDFDYEGSAINTIIDLLTRNTTYNAFLANMLANESFLESAQVRSNVVSHSQKLSYVPKSDTASRAICTIDVTPSNTDNLPTSIVLDQGSVFLSSVGGNTYSFTTNTSYSMTYNSTRGTFRATDVEVFQGQKITNRFVHSFGDKIVIPNSNCDRSTLVVTTSESSGNSGVKTYNRATAIDQLNADSSVFFASENSRQQTVITFGRDILGVEPAEGAIVSVSYVAVEDDFANGVTSLIGASTIAGYSNISVDVTTPSYGGTPREDIERIRFIAPKYYQAQGRALTDSDYVPILQSQFPFIRSAISWGGEKNSPPVYGTVFISIISDEGGLVTTAVKQQMTTFLGDRNVGSVTPTIVDPEIFGIDLRIAFSYDNRKTSKTFNELDTEVKSVVSNYNLELNDFGQFYNESELSRRIMEIKGITSISIDKVQFKEIDVLRFQNPVYIVNFSNSIQPGSVNMTGFRIAANGMNHVLYDDEAGVLFVSYTTESGNEVTNEVGTVDYEEGSIEFIINMIQDANEVKLEVETEEDNFYVTQNRVVYINDVETSLLSLADRQSTGVRV